MNIIPPRRVSRADSDRRRRVRDVARYQDEVRWTPETVLVEGLRKLGHDVAALAHTDQDFATYDIVHVHHLSWGAVAAATDRSGTPFVFTLHAARAARPRAAAFVMSRADGIVALWEGQGNEFARTFSISGAELAVIPNGVDSRIFRFAQPEPPLNQPWQLLYVGQLIPVKGVDLLLNALGELRSRHDVQLRLSFHGGAEEPALRALAAELRIEDVVTFLGRTPQDRLSEVLHASHIVVLPSLDRGVEALPSALTESLLTGRYAVSTNVGGVSDQLGEFGVVVPPGDTEALVRGIEQAMQTYNAHCARARAMSEWAAERYAVEGMVSAHERLYTNILREPKDGARRHEVPLELGTKLGGPLLRLKRRLRNKSSEPA